VSNCPEEIIEYMHDYLDEEIAPEHEQVLREHLQTCADCRKHFLDLKKTIALVQSTAHIKAPADLTNKIMANLPHEKRKVGVKRWFNHHPFLAAAAVFMILMTASALSVWDQNDNFAVTKHENIVVENNTAVIPEGEVVEGDIVVRNGDILIEGKVEGNVTVINGERLMASAGEVTGEIKEINAIFEWLWFNIKDFFQKITDM
jgi:anti-sigma factor RsiW